MMAMRWATRIFLVLLAGLTVGCASRSAKAVEPDRGAWADELVRQGCYDCLLDARTAYERLAATSAGALTRVFEIDLLLALREKELSIDPTATLAHAESLVLRLAKVPAGDMLAIVKAIPEDSGGRRVQPPPTREAAQQIDSALASVDASPFSPEFKGYLRLSLECGRLTGNQPSG